MLTKKQKEKLKTKTCNLSFKWVAKQNFSGNVTPKRVAEYVDLNVDTAISLTEQAVLQEVYEEIDGEIYDFYKKDVEKYNDREIDVLVRLKSKLQKEKD